MKKFIKSRIFAFILGALIFSGITGVAAYSIFASDISYTPENTTWEVDNVKDAIDQLYDKTENFIDYDSTYYNYSMGDLILNRTTSLTLNKGKYLVNGLYTLGFALDTTYNASVYSTDGIKLSCTDNNCKITKMMGKFYRHSATTTSGNRYPQQISISNLYLIEVNDDNTILEISSTNNNTSTNQAQCIALHAIKLNK